VNRRETPTLSRVSYGSGLGRTPEPDEISWVFTSLEPTHKRGFLSSERMRNNPE